jgi:hypothetical protein
MKGKQGKSTSGSRGKGGGSGPGRRASQSRAAADRGRGRGTRGGGRGSGRDPAQDASRQDFQSFLVESGAVQLIVQALLRVYEARSRPADIGDFLAIAFAELSGDRSRERIRDLEAEVAELTAQITELELRLEGREAMQDV